MGDYNDGEQSSCTGMSTMMKIFIFLLIIYLLMSMSFGVYKYIKHKTASIHEEQSNT